MEATLSRSSEKMLFRTLLAQAMDAERQISKIIPRMIDAVWSAELSRTFRAALLMSRQHQEQLLANFDLQPGKARGSTLEELGSRIDIAIDSQQKGSSKDLSLTILLTKMIRYKIKCYESAMNKLGSETRQDKRMIGGALSDETATDLFLQELSERFILKQYSRQ